MIYIDGKGDHCQWSFPAPCPELWVLVVSGLGCQLLSSWFWASSWIWVAWFGWASFSTECCLAAFMLWLGTVQWLGAVHLLCWPVQTSSSILWPRAVLASPDIFIHPLPYQGILGWSGADCNGTKWLRQATGLLSQRLVWPGGWSSRRMMLHHL